jgi:hypothetical protein
LLGLADIFENFSSLHTPLSLLSGCYSICSHAQQIGWIRICEISSRDSRSTAADGDEQSQASSQKPVVTMKTSSPTPVTNPTTAIFIKTGAIGAAIGLEGVPAKQSRDFSPGPAALSARLVRDAT